MARALRAAAEDATASAAGGPAAAGHALIRRADSIRVVVPLGWRSVNPPSWWPSDSASTPTTPPRAHADRHRGQHTAGAAARCLPRHLPGRPRRRPGDRGRGHVHPGRLPARSRQAGPELGQPAGRGHARSRPCSGPTRPGATDLEMSRGVILPIHAYPLFENALRAANGWTLAEHRRASAPCGPASARWPRPTPTPGSSPPHPEEITTPSPDNRMVSFPYPKLCTANMQVDQGAGYIVCSVEAARAAGVPEERWVFPLAGPTPRPLVHFAPARAPPLARHPAGRPRRPRTGRHRHRRPRSDRPVLLLPAWCRWRRTSSACPSTTRPGRLTLTGGLTFGGGPGQQLHLARHRPAGRRAARRARERWAGHRAGWYATKHSVGCTPARPPTHEGRGRSPGATCSPRSTCSPSARWTPRPPARSGSRPTR
jgi:hypothetical protein